MPGLWQRIRRSVIRPGAGEPDCRTPCHTRFMEEGTKGTTRPAEAAAAQAMARRYSGYRRRPGSHVHRRGDVVTVRAEIDAELYRQLTEQDAAVLGIDASGAAIVREAIRLLHEHAQDIAADERIREFYHGEKAPLPDGVAPADAE